MKGFIIQIQPLTTLNRFSIDECLCGDSRQVPGSSGDRCHSCDRDTGHLYFCLCSLLTLSLPPPCVKWTPRMSLTNSSAIHFCSVYFCSNVFCTSRRDVVVFHNADQCVHHIFGSFHTHTHTKCLSGKLLNFHADIFFMIQKENRKT